MNPNHAQRNAQLAIRLGLAFVFLIFGIDKFRGEEVQLASWADWVPRWFSTLIGGQVKVFISVLGIFEILVGLAFLTGYLLFWAALLSSLFLLATVLLSTSGLFFGGLDQYTIRDIGLLGGTISLLFFPGSRRR